MKTTISSTPLQPISSSLNFDELTSPTVKTLDDGVKITGVVTGHSETYSKNLDFDITFIVPELTLGETGGGAGGGNVAFDNLYPNPIPTDCLIVQTTKVKYV